MSVALAVGEEDSEVIRGVVVDVGGEVVGGGAVGQERSSMSSQVL